MNFALIKEAGLSQTEFGQLPGVGVGRATVNLWVSGKMHPNRYIRDEVAKVLQKVEQALQDKKLPLPEVPELDKEARLAEICQRLALN